MKGRYLLPGADEVLVNRIFLIGQKKLKLILERIYTDAGFFINERIFSNAMPVVSL